MDYWKKRLADEQAKITDKSIAATNKQLQKYYLNSYKKVVKDYESLYNKVLEARMAGEEITPAWLYQLDKYYELQAQISTELTTLGEKEIKALSNAFENQYKSIQDSIEIPDSKLPKSTFNTVGQQQAKQVLQSVWCSDGKNFSDRVWNDKSLLAQTLNDNLVHCAITGKNTSELKKTLLDSFGVSHNRANTLVRTEMAHIQNEAALNRYKDYGIGRVEILADQDGRTCEQCEELDGKKFAIGTEPTLPLHPNCRCCLLPVVEDDNEKDEEIMNEDLEKVSRQKGIDDESYLTNEDITEKEIRLGNRHGWDYDKMDASMDKWLQGKITQCKVCGKLYNPSVDDLGVCPDCTKNNKIQSKKKASVWTNICPECGKVYYTTSNQNASKRCPECQAKKRLEDKAAYQREYRKKKKK